MQPLEDNHAIVFRNTCTGERLRYDKLMVQDATGHELASRMQTQGLELWLEVQEAAAVYPVTIDPIFSQQQKLVASDAANSDVFGHAVGIGENTIVIGAPIDSNAAGAEQGSAYVFTRVGTEWTQQQKLTASDAAAGDQFGWSVAISGETIVIGARQDNLFQGSAYVFVHTGTTWTQQQKLEADDAAVDDQFGFTVGVSGETIVVGALGDDYGGGENQGSAYVFARVGTVWTQQQKLTGASVTSDQFGSAVGISGETIVVGAFLGDGGGIDQGIAYIFTRIGTTWTQQQRLTAMDAAANDRFGYDVAISGDSVVIGAVNTGRSDTGSAYVFTRTGTIWTQQQKLTASDAATDDLFGYAVGISGNVIVAGAPQTDSPPVSNKGSVYVFVRNGAIWTQQQELEANDPATNDFFGISVGISNGSVVVGASADDDMGHLDQGSAYAFTGIGNTNTPPTISAFGISRTEGGSPTASLICTVNDTEDAKDILQAQISSDGLNFGNAATLNGVTVTLTDSNVGATGINPNAAGQVFADVVAACGANNATFTLKATDSGGLMTTTPLTVTVNANTPPVLSYNNPAALVFGIGATINPATGPSDSDGIASLVLQSKGEFTGNVSINSSGVVTLSNAAPIGTHTITIRATDNCNQTTDATFTVTVSSCTDATLVTFSNLRTDGRMYRYRVTPTSATLDLTFTHPDLQFPHHGIVIPTTGELLVCDKGTDASGNLSSFLRFGDPLGAMTYGSKFRTADMISSFWMAIRNNELFVPQGLNSNSMLRFLIGANGNLTPNGIITAGLGNTSARGVVLTPWGELFVTRCCGDNYIVRYKFDANGNITLNGTISGNGLSNPHGMVFSSRGELFVANFDSHTVSRFTFDANRNASPNGQITNPSFARPIDVAFSPWGELFVSNDGGARITRFVFDNAHNTTFSGSISTPSNLHGLLFLQPSSVCTLSPPPTVTSLGATSQAGSPAVNAQIGTALDAEDAEDILQLQISSDGTTFGNSATLNGVTVTLTDKNPVAAGTNPDSAGKIFADVVAACDAASTSFTIRAIDSSGVTGLASLAINVTANTPPLLSYNSVAVAVSGDAIVNPLTGPSDNGIASLAVHDKGTFTGDVSVNSSGVVTLSNAGPVGTHNITIRATDNCNLFTDASFTLTVNNTPPTISSAILMRTAGAGSSNSTIANVSDTEQAANTLSVTVNGAASATVNGVTISGLSISAGGVVTANVDAAAVGAASADFTLRVTDSQNATATTTLVVIVTTSACSSGSVPVWNQQAKNTASDGQLGYQFGTSVAISGDTAVIGTPFATIPTGAGAGAAYIFTRSGNAWIQQQKLTAYDSAAFDSFGYSVAISGDTVVVGAYLDDTGGGTNAGSAYVFTRSLGVWALQQKLIAIDGTQDDRFGNSVGISGDTIIVGAFGDDWVLGAAHSGSAYIFTRITNTWSQQQKLRASDGAAYDAFGNSVAISGDTAIIGAFTDSTVSGGPDAGSAYLFVRNNAVWTEQQHLIAPDGAEGEHFGISVAISGDTSIVGAHLTNTTLDGPNVGSAYVFVRSGTAWALQQKLLASDRQHDDQFGYSVAIDGDTVIVSAVFDDTSLGGTDAGSAYIFTRSAGVWTQQQKLTASDGAGYDAFGYSLGISGDAVIIGANTDDTTSDGANAGSSYIFTRSCNRPPTITVQAGLAHQQASPVSNSHIATVGDTEDLTNTLQIQISSDGSTFSNTATLNGVTITLTDSNAGANGINPNDIGQVFADVVAACGASNAGFTLKVIDSSGAVATVTLSVSVNANTAPTVGIYANTSVLPNGSVTVTPNASPVDNGTIQSVTAAASPNTFTGSFNGNTTTGAVTVTNAAPSGTYTITVTVTDNCGATAQRTFTLTVNTAPTINALTNSRQPGSPVSNSTIANVADVDGGALTVTVNSNTSATTNGVTVSNLALNNGVVTANIVADCSATNAGFTLTVTDNNNAMATATLNVAVTTNTAPTLSYNNPPALIFNNGMTINPATGPSDNGSVNSIFVQSQGTFTGTVTVNNVTGAVTVGNAAPIGTHTITIGATDNCNQTTAASFTLTVNNTPPTITAGEIAVRQQGSAGAIHTIGAVNDTETPRANLSVTVMSAPAGVNVTAISAPNAVTGEVTALVEAACTAATGANVVVLKVTDGNGDTATANLTVNVTANTAPSLSYNNPSVNFGGALTVTPATAADNGSIASFALQSQGTYAGTINVSSATGELTLGNVRPVGMHTITIRATDNCGLTKDAGFTLTVAQAASITSITADSPDSSAVGQNVTVAFTVAAAPPGAGTPTGNVTVGDGVSSCTGALSNGSGSCVVALTTAGNRTLMATYAGDGNFSGSSATEAHTVVAPPQIAIAFSPNAVLLNQTSTLTISLTNPAGNTLVLTGVGVLDDFSAGLEVDATPMIGNSCNTGLFAASAGAAGVNVSNATIPVGVTCTFSVKLKATTPGLKTNVTGNVVSDNGGSGLTASAQLQVNGPPVIMPIPLSLAAGSSARPFDIATVNDAEDGPLPLTFGISADGDSFGASASKNGVTVTFLSIGADGKIRSDVSTSCTATTASFTLKATDRDNQVTTASWTVTVTANTPPTLGYAGQGVMAGVTPIFTPLNGPVDNGAVAEIALQSITPATGLALSVNNQTGAVSVTSAGVGGAYTVVVRATDDCGLMTDATFTVQVGCPPISLGPITLPTAAVNTSYPHSLTASPTGTIYNFAVTSGALPNGLTLSSNGSFSGAPTQNGVFNFRVAATGWGGCTVFHNYVLAVECPVVTVMPSNLPSGTIGTAYNQTVSATPAGTYSFSVTSGALPPGLTLNAATGAITGTPSQAGSFSFTVTAAVSSCSGARSFTVTIDCPALTLASLGNATAGVSFSGSVAASPSGVYTYSLQSGNLPSGFTLHPSTGAVTGLTAVPGTYSFTIKAQTANGCSSSQIYSLTVVCPSITLSALATPSLNSSYNQTVTASPLGNYSFAITAGALPAGLSLNSASGLLSGTPTVAGTYNFTIRATAFGSCTGVREYSFVIGGAGCPGITLPATLPAGSVGQLYNSAVVASPAGLYNYALTVGSLPPGVILYGDRGLLNGYPTAAGSYGFTIRATGANNCANSQSYTVNIGLGLMPESLPQAAVGQAYRQALTSLGAQGEARFAVVAGALPPEMTLSREGVLSGTPNEPGTHAFTVQVSDNAGFTGKRDYTLVLPPIFPPPSDPLAMTAAIDGCAVGGGTVGVTMTVRNFGVVSAPVNFEAPLPAGARALPDSCAANLGACAATPQQVVWNGNLSPNQTVTITFRIQFDDNLSTQTCLTASAKVVNVFGAPATASACAVNCMVVGPGARLAAVSPISDVKAGSVLLYNIYTSATDPTRQNTRLSITNTDPARQAFVHLFFVDGASCSVADSFLCLTPNQTTSFLASDLDPGTTGYVVAVATDATGCPTNFNFLIGDEYVKFQSGHAANLGAQAITAIAGGLPVCDTNSSTATLNFDGVSYAPVPRVLALDSIPSRADGNDTMLILNRIGGNLGTGVATLGPIFGILYDDAEVSLSFTLTGGCQLRGSVTNNFPRTAPRFEQFIPAGRTGWMKIYSQSDDSAIGLTGAAINFNANATASAGAFNQGHNLHALTNTSAMSYVIPVFPPGC